MPVDTKGAIIQAYQELLEERKNLKITVADIVEKCGISRKTFYYHFDNIYDLMEVMATRRLAAFFAELGSEDVKEAIKKFFLFMQAGNENAKLNVESPQFRQFTKHLFLKLQEYFSDFLERSGCYSALTKAEFDLVVHAVSYTVLGLALEENRTEEQIDELVETMFHLGTSGIGLFPPNS